MAEFSSPIAGGLLRIRRSRVSSFSFLNRPQEQQPREDYRTTLALQQNRLAFDNINSSLINLSNQVAVLSASLDGIAQRVREDSALDQAREAQKQRQEQILAEQQLKEGKESVVERKMQSSLLKPIRKVGDKARFTLGRLGNFFMILLAGFLGNIALSTISALISGDKERLEELKQKFLKNIGVVTGIFLLFSGGLTTILGYITRIGVKLGSSVFRNLLLRPVNALINLVKEGVKGIAKGLGLAPKAAPKTPPAKTPPAKPTRPSKPTSPGGTTKPGTTKPGPGTFRSTALWTMAFEFLLGSSVGETTSSTTGAATAAKTAQILGNVLLGPRLKAIQGLVTGISAIIGSQVFKKIYRESGVEEKIPELGTSIDIFGAAFDGKPLIDVPKIRPKKPEDDKLQSYKNPDNNSGGVTVINSESTASAGGVQRNTNLGAANYLPQIPTSQGDNFYLTTSQLVYNAGFA